METIRIQCWPSGRSYTYSGDPHGPELTIHTESGPVRATDAERREILISRLAEIYSDRDVFAVQSSLVDMLIKNEVDGFSVDDLELNPDPSDWDIEQCREWVSDHGGTEPDDDDIADAEDEDELLELWRSAVRECDPPEVYEWWLVSSWLAKQLASIGVPTIQNGYGDWWGRTCTGQSYLMDGVLQRVAAQFAE